MKITYIVRTFIHYFRSNLLVALGVMISTAVLTGSLVIGDSVRYSLEQSTFYRLGNMTHVVTVTDRYFRSEMARDLEVLNPLITTAPAMVLEGVAVSGGGQQRVNRVQIVGIDSSFYKMAGTNMYSELQGNEVAVSKNLSERLQVQEGDAILIRIKKASLIPMNAPFVSDDETSVTLRATIKKVVDRDELSRFSLKNSQTAPMNVFLSLEQLNRLMDFQGKANHLMINSPLETDKLKEAVDQCITPEDAGLQVKLIEATGETEVTTERVFMDAKIAEVLTKLTGASPLLTYFVNEISPNHCPAYQESEDMYQRDLTVTQTNSEKPSIKGIPYSFVSTLARDKLTGNEMILNQWAADDLKVKKGDTLRIKYLEIGPLRRLVEKDTFFVLKDIVPMTPEWTDATRMPHLPGLSDAGHCREWEAGVPINLDAIRDKDEDYWDLYKGAPKAFVSLDMGLALWENRFGKYTAVRFPSGSFKNDLFETNFAENISPGDLGMAIEPVREKGIHAAQNGTDFSGLFIGLSFFLLAAAIILTSLLFRLNLENRASQAGLLNALGFSGKQVQSFFLSEGAVVILFGTIMGLLLSFWYTSLIFKILNSLWFEIVRTDVLLLHFLPGTMIAGLATSFLISLLAIYLSVRRFQKQKIADLQKQLKPVSKRDHNKLLNRMAIFLLILSAGLFIFQVAGKSQFNPGLFFLTGAFLLAGLLLSFKGRLSTSSDIDTGNLNKWRLIFLNLKRNTGRSVTVVTLFALGTFVVVSTGSNKLDLFANAQNKKSGTGGFLFFAETTMPVLFDINNPDKRNEEGLTGNFHVVQFRKVEGDDASCLNLNRIVQPAILGVNPEELEDRFSFAGNAGVADHADPWTALDSVFEDGTIPAIADQTVIQWGLGMKTGDILLYQNETGDTLRLRLIAGTKPSLFQGYVIISEKHFLANYPASSGTSVFLVDGAPESQEAIGEELSSVFRDYGWEMTTTARRLVEFYSVTNTYLSIFLALGALGLILGTAGLAVILARTLLERRREIAVMISLGFSVRAIFSILSSEYMILLATGVLTGFAASVIAVLPAFLSSGSDASFSTVTMVTGIIIINGFLWILALTAISLRRKNLIAELRME